MMIIPNNQVAARLAANQKRFGGWGPQAARIVDDETGDETTWIHGLGVLLRADLVCRNNPSEAAAPADERRAAFIRSAAGQPLGGRLSRAMDGAHEVLMTDGRDNIVIDRSLVEIAEALSCQLYLPAEPMTGERHVVALLIDGHGDFAGAFGAMQFASPARQEAGDA